MKRRPNRCAGTCPTPCPSCCWAAWRLTAPAESGARPGAFARCHAAVCTHRQGDWGLRDLSACIVGCGQAVLSVARLCGIASAADDSDYDDGYDPRYFVGSGLSAAWQSALVSSPIEIPSKSPVPYTNHRQPAEPSRDWKGVDYHWPQRIFGQPIPWRLSNTVPNLGALRMTHANPFRAVLTWCESQRSHHACWGGECV